MPRPRSEDRVRDAVPHNKGIRMTVRARRFATRALGLALLSFPSIALAHGYVGNRFFPATVSTDDPFAVDELALPTVSWVRSPGADGGAGFHDVNASFEFDKEIFPRFAIGVSGAYVYRKPDRGRTTQGWDNFGLTAKYQAWENAPHEAIVSVGLEADLGGTGNKRIGESFTTVSPVLYVGKGFGDLPEGLSLLQPFALTGTFAQTFPFKPESPNTFEWGFAIEYSLPYLHQHVKDVGLPAPFKDMIPLIEFAFETAENRGEGGITTGTINPGVLWESPLVQLGVEANIPVNSRSGTHVGVTVQAWIYIDDIFPRVFGHPIFGGER